MAINLQDPFNLAGITDPAERNVLLQGGVNRIDQTVPGGRIEYSGPGRSASTITLDPALQNIFDARTEAARSAANVAGGLITGLEGGRAGVEKAFYDKQIGLLSPTLDQNESRLESQLLNRGLPESSEAYANAYNLQARDPRLRAYNDAALNAILSGGNELANTTTAARNLFNLDPNVGIPNTQSFTAPAAVDVTGAEQLKFQANQAANNAKLAADKIQANIEAGNFSALTTLGSAVITGLLTSKDTSIGGKVASSILSGAASVGKSVYGFLKEHLGFGAEAVTEAVQSLQQTAQIPPTGDFYPDLIPSGVFPSTDVPLPPAGEFYPDLIPSDVFPSTNQFTSGNKINLNAVSPSSRIQNASFTSPADAVKPELITDPTVLGQDLTEKVNQSILSDPYYMSEGIDDLFTGNIGPATPYGPQAPLPAGAPDFYPNLTGALTGTPAQISAQQAAMLYPGAGGEAAAQVAAVAPVGDLATSGATYGAISGAISGGMKDGFSGAFAGGVEGSLQGGIAGGISAGLAWGALGATGIGAVFVAAKMLYDKQQAKDKVTNLKQTAESANFTRIIRRVSGLAGVPDFDDAQYRALIESVGLADPIGVTPDMKGATAAGAGFELLLKHPKLIGGTNIKDLSVRDDTGSRGAQAAGKLVAVLRLPGMAEKFTAYINGQISGEEFSLHAKAAGSQFKVDNAAKIREYAQQRTDAGIQSQWESDEGRSSMTTAQREAKARQVQSAAIKVEAVVPEIAKAKQVATDLRAEAVAQQAAGIPYYDRGRAIQDAQNAEKRADELVEYQAQQRFISDHDKPEMWTMYDDYSGNDPVRVRSDKYYDLLVATGMPDPRTWDEEMKGDYPPLKSVWKKNTFSDTDDLGGDEVEEMVGAGTGSFLGDAQEIGQDILSMIGLGDDPDVSSETVSY